MKAASNMVTIFLDKYSECTELRTEILRVMAFSGHHDIRKFAEEYPLLLALKHELDQNSRGHP